MYKEDSIIERSKRNKLLISLFKKLIKVIRNDNDYAFKLLREVTSERETIIELDGYKVSLASKDKNKYILIAKKAPRNAQVYFKTTSSTLREIMNGTMNIDKAVCEERIFIKAPINDVINVFKLTSALLAEGSINTSLRNLWKEFNDSWLNEKNNRTNYSLNGQQPDYTILINEIPESVLLIKV